MANLLTIETVHKTYPATRRSGEVVALEDISFSVPQGQFVAIVGPSGCGKSTLMNIASGIDVPSGGVVTHNGETVLGPSHERGVVFQQYLLFPWMTVQANVEFGPRSRGVDRQETTKVANRYIEMVGLNEFGNRYPHELSGGMQQRCALARVLANDPTMLLMDEPLAAVDAQTRAILQEELLTIWGEHGFASEKKTIIFITHSIDEAVFLADRILVMARKPGRIIKDIDNTIKRPRINSRRDPLFGEMVDSIWSLLHDQAAAAARG